MTRPDALPPWLFAHVQKCRDAFGLGHAGFAFHLDQVDVVDSEPGVAGTTVTDARYHRAVVTVRRAIAPDAAGYEIVTHEALHAATGAMRQAVDRIIELVPAELRDHAEELWQDGNEATVTQLARGLTPLLCAMDVSTPTKKRGKKK
jgi:hypothetical protein